MTSQTTEVVINHAVKIENLGQCDKDLMPVLKFEFHYAGTLKPYDKFSEQRYSKETDSIFHDENRDSKRTSYVSPHNMSPMKTGASSQSIYHQTKVKDETINLPPKQIIFESEKAISAKSQDKACNNIINPIKVTKYKNEALYIKETHIPEEVIPQLQKPPLASATPAENGMHRGTDVLISSQIHPSGVGFTLSCTLGVTSVDGQTQNKSKINEALVAMHYGNLMKNSGRYQKAERLLKHALALSPDHPDILNSYGEHLEGIRCNYVEADSYYKKALSVSPRHSHALENHKRTLPLVEKFDECMLQNIARTKEKIVNFPGEAVLSKVSDDIKFQYIYHTTGIEGNTMSLAETREVLESQKCPSGKSLTERNEILGIDSALKYLWSTLLNKPGDISEKDILQIHEYVLGMVDPGESGTYRHTQVYINGHKPPPPQDVKFLMSEFIIWLNSSEARSLHPIKYAALAHYKLVNIHPFTDETSGFDNRCLNDKPSTHDGKQWEPQNNGTQFYSLSQNVFLGFSIVDFGLY
ncbi:hypothetical protein QYM36_007260 [Artemia franciscana]|uniref:Protein adenylyltransferase Fic n=1 Tax=Artemia franciscana TaxID=6661 RepID=A0AA88HTW0_ARTSF|nr:hypothetical protein QYM36_007260 [Artemia franciscana]